MKFMYVGEGTTEAFGIVFNAGEPVEVTDEYAIRKLKAHHLFTHDETPAPVEPEKPRRGRKPKETDAQ